jgi:hypothetical protein
MRLLTVGAALLLVGLATGSASPADKKSKKPTEADFFGVWIEERRETGKKVLVDPFDLFGWDLAAKDGGCWERRGESVYTSLGRVRLRIDKDPVWLDFIGSTFKVKVGNRWVEKVHIRPGIAMRDGKKLVWIWSTGWCVADPKEIADWTYRPKSFDLKKDDYESWEKKLLYRGSGRYRTD